MAASLRDQLDSILPATVTSFKVVYDYDHEFVPVLHAGAMTLDITGPFVGRQGHNSLWDEVEPETLTTHLEGFEGKHLLAVDSGEGWLHLDFTNGWIRIVATVGDSWVLDISETIRIGSEHDDPLKGNEHHAE
ncbi:hypothetical protein [uncultured Propionibacterium sp.]|uniref:hypothetical protein n=1 Tax=uncultured Propionibacterium sp. TaxID=218066 RepID=UPI00292E2099|nr:hypothetical protein [uncultured Propionibacterium sp.]